MNLINTSTEIKNSNLLFLLLGTLFIPVINSVDSLLTNIFRMTFSILEVSALLWISIAFHGLVLISLIYMLISIIRLRKVKIPGMNISLKTLKTIGISFIIIIVSAAALTLYVRKYFNKEIDLTKVYDVDSTELAYMFITQSGLILLRNVILFISFFLILFKQSPHDKIAD